MKHLIDKSALVAEINRVLNSYDPNEITSGRYALVNLRDFLDTLEVNEEVTTTDAFIEKACKYISCHQCEYIDFEDFRKAMKGE